MIKTSAHFGILDNKKDQKVYICLRKSRLIWTDAPETRKGNLFITFLLQ